MEEWPTNQQYSKEPKTITNNYNSTYILFLFYLHTRTKMLTNFASKKVNESTSDKISKEKKIK